MSENDLQKMKSCEVLTPFPVPIIIRKDLEEELPRTEGPVYGYSTVNFYMLFNRNLLDKEKLSQMIAEKNRQIKEEEENYKIRDKEFAEYSNALAALRGQSLTAEQYDRAKAQVNNLQNIKDAIEKRLPDKEKQLEQIKEEQGELRRSKEELQTVLQNQRQRQDAFNSVCEAYAQYLKIKDTLDECTKRLSEIDTQTGDEKEKLSRLQEQREVLVRTDDKLREEMKGLQEKCVSYGMYKPVSRAEELHEDIDILESKYKAIKDEYTKDFQERLDRYKNAVKHYQAALDKLHKLEAEYGLCEEAYAGISYNSHEERLLKEQASDTKEKIKKESKIKQREKNEICNLQGKQGEQLKTIKEQFQNEAPIPRDELTDTNFSERLQELKEETDQLYKQQKEMGNRNKKYQAVLRNMSNYEILDKGQEVKEKTDVSVMGLEAIGSYAEKVKGNLEEKRWGYDGASASMKKLLKRIKEQCQGSDYTSQTVDSLLALADNIQGLEEQLAVISESYKAQLEVLSINLKHVEEEKEAIVMQLTAYIQSVLENLEKIDDHSTIQVGGKMRKMLQIKSPGWNENETIYKGRVQSFVDAMTNNLMAELDAGRNAGEYCRLNVNTVELFDAVIGINNIDVRIYKVEENGIRPMSWNEVSKNSGGERFLSSFIVLSSLLCYMRSGIYESAGLGSNKKESKVLLMDNPFGVITSEHLLKPLMEMAQKTNTQLICLSDAKGEAIYGRFDNIYAMNQYESRLRPGMIIDAERIKGESIKSIEAAQVEVYDQLSFNF